MTDKEIIKAWNEEIHLANYVNEDYRNAIKVSLIKNTLACINRQQVEKEALIAGQETMSKCIAEQQAEIERLKSDNEKISATTRKEFAERLKKYFNSLDFRVNTHRKTVSVETLHAQVEWVLRDVVIETIDAALKEMEVNYNA